MGSPVSKRISDTLEVVAPVMRFFTDSPYARRVGDPSICDFAIGNPHEMPLDAFWRALARRSEPQNKDWFAYKMSEPASQRFISERLREERGVRYEPGDIFMTNGAFAGLSAVLCAVTDPGDEVIYLTPPWFFYESLIVSLGAVPVRVKVDFESFDLDLEAIESAITARTRAIIVNSPNNPTGKVYPQSTLLRLSSLLEQASARFGRVIYLLSDESYYRIIFERRDFPSPAATYPNSFVIYTYGKVLLAPGQRIGYIAVSPTMMDRESVHQALFMAQIVTGYAFPNALLQHALPDLDALSLDMVRLEYKRDWMVRELRAMGYELHIPEGTFYILPRSPMADDVAFLDLLAAQNIYCLPGTVVEMPGYFRVSLTANDRMIERAMAGFAEAMKQARSMSPTAA